MAQELGDAHPLIGVIFHDQQPLAARLGIFLDAVERLFEAFRRRRLVDEGEGAARQAVLAILVEGHDLHGDVARRRVLLQLAQHAPAQHVGQEHIERHCVGFVFACQRQRIGAAHRDQDLDPLVMREIGHDPRIMRIVLDDQQHRLAGLETVAIVGHLLDRGFEPRVVEHDRGWCRDRCGLPNRS